MVYRAWNAHVKHGKDKWLQQQATKVEQITLMRQDWEFILDFAEKCPDNDLQLLLISVVDMCYGLEALAELYWQLIALNDLVENAENANFHLPESFVKRWQICFSTVPMCSHGAGLLHAAFMRKYPICRVWKRN